MKRILGGDILKVCVNQRENLADVAKIKAVLSEETIRENVISLSVHPTAETFRIRLKPAVKLEIVYRICGKLNDTGYSTRIIPVRQLSGRNTDAFHYSRFSRHCNSATRACNIIIIAKVNAPNTPEKPYELPDPRGEKPKKQK